MLAANHDRIDIAQLFLTHGANPGTIDKKGRTAVEYFPHEGGPGFVKLIGIHSNI